ncbi:ABC transporter ATP-binding protein [Streptomyces sp. NBC_00669]|uniref:ABC transporter ATP-binding protein n=1 Tax=Streptomyces sp. NBC_00669 TaxID=2976011 RepID=UPI002E34B05B|nr:ABC transporter ATP-binding protein [Streptomyces sp. NBC_00669]
MTTIEDPPTARTHPLARFPGYDPAAPPLEVVDLRVAFAGRTGRPGAGSVVVDGVGYRTEPGRTLAVVGESGCGKSLTARAVMGILPPGAAVTGGSILLHGIDLLRLDRRALRKIRGRHIAMVFQDALSALNPVLPVGFQIAEVFRAHRGLTRRQAAREAVAMLDRVRIADAARRAGHYPHQFSGGMRQRVMIAMALALTPEVLIADEPTTALDVTVQAQILELLADLQAEHAISLVLISHDMGIVANAADRVVVMYAGRVAEQAPAGALYRGPAHPYTRALLDAIPRRGSRGRPLAVLEGAPPDPAAMPDGCAFRARCRYADEACAVAPPHHGVAPLRTSACHHWKEVVGG